MATARQRADADHHGQAQIRQKKQEVEVAVSQSGTNVATTTDVGGGQHRGSLAAGDWIQLNGPFNLVNINSLTFRVADAAGRSGRRLTAGGGRASHGLGDRADRGHVQPGLDRRHDRLDEPDVPDLAGGDE